MPHLPHYGPAEGPLGFPMPDKQARALDTLLKTLPKSKDYEYRKALVAKAPTELNPGERSDVSWISTESVDRTGEVVVARGMNDSQFQGNPLVTLGHAYHLPPVGRSLWRRRVKDGDRAGIKAKTQYPPRPDSWPAGDEWLPDKVLALVQAGLLQGKSIGFLPTRVHVPNDMEAAKNGWGNDVSLVIDEWLLLEYACVFLPANQDALVESVAKGMPVDLLPADDPVIAFTAWEEVERAVARHVSAENIGKCLAVALKEIWERAAGRVQTVRMSCIQAPAPVDPIP